MAAKPELLLFLGTHTSSCLNYCIAEPTLDEPTSGLDSQTAWTICALLRKLANNGQAILCTIHQPSAQLFEHFDSILLLDHQGNELYFGDIGPSSRTLINYFEINGAPPCEPKENSASWLFKATGNNPGTENSKDWASIWATSPEKAAVKNQLLQFKSEAGRDGHNELHNLIDDSDRSEDEYCASSIRQILTVTKRQFCQYWRLPDYSWGITSLGIGFVGSPRALELPFTCKH
jgi:ATP-binding cassette subfamily G (WHITE) protein 2 (PDR)